jgi:hypothetical protein
VRAGSVLQLRPAGVGEHRVGDPRIARALGLLDEPGAFEPVQEPRDARCGQLKVLDQIRPPQTLPVGVRQEQQRLVVVDRQAPVRAQLGVQLANGRRMAAQEADPGIQGSRFGFDGCGQST